MRRRRSRALVGLANAICLVTAANTFAASAPAPDRISHQRFHLRSGSEPEWDEFKRRTPDGAGLTLQFSARTNASEATLFLSQDNVKQDWRVQLNGRRIGALFLMEAPVVHTLSVPPGMLRDGQNVLVIDAPINNDDIEIGPILLDPRPAKVALTRASLDVDVVDSESNAALPSRVTVLDENGSLAALYADQNVHWAVRPGVAYTGTGQIRLGLLPGRYTIYANRGFEYGVASAQVTAEVGQTIPVHLRIRREVPTAGWICTDTHVHTATYAKHGDATIEERAVTLAGEGIELPISTEHNCLVDLSGAAARTGVEQWFTPVIGEEVTTTVGHFNIFPISLNATLPDHKITDWPRLMSAFRATPGVQVVVLNHPRNIHNNFQPFAATNFNAATGENLRGFEFSFDAIEVANSSALQSDWRASFNDWFGLLNYGYRVTAVGSSDGHDVSRYIVGQGRTYVLADDATPARLDIAGVCRNLKAGRASVSLGLFADLQVNSRFGIGDLATNLSPQIQVKVTVRGPAWVSADRVELFANGVRIRDERIPPPQIGSTSSEPYRYAAVFEIPRPKHDVHLIALATGPAVQAPYWAMARPYQPSSPRWDPRILGCTNPIWIDADQDGRFTSARAYAQRLVAAHRTDRAALQRALADCDEAIAAQVASLEDASRDRQAVAPEPQK